MFNGPGRQNLPQNYVSSDKKHHNIAIIFAIVFAVLFVVTLVFALSVFSGKQELDNNFNRKLKEAVGVAVESAESAKDAEFAEKEKSPYEVYIGPQTYGSLSFSYPKTWSVYQYEKNSKTVLDLYLHPKIVPDISSEKPYALRVEISTLPYDREVEAFQKDVEQGLVISEPFRAANVPSVLGLKITGEIRRDISGSMILLPLRDRTIKVFTESSEFINDFNNTVLPSLRFVP